MTFHEGVRTEGPTSGAETAVEALLNPKATCSDEEVEAKDSSVEPTPFITEPPKAAK